MEKPATFRVEIGVAQGCSLSPVLFSVFINGLLKGVKETGLGIEINSGKRMGGMLFADDLQVLVSQENALLVSYISTKTGADERLLWVRVQ